jgi:hypothetical protein
MRCVIEERAEYNHCRAAVLRFPNERLRNLVAGSGGSKPVDMERAVDGRPLQGVASAAAV